MFKRELIDLKDGTWKVPTNNPEVWGIVSDDDAWWVRLCNWSDDGQGYLRAKIGKRLFRLHRLITRAEPGQHVDHISGCKTDNRRCNLRVATIQENNRNRGAQKNNTSGFKGVTWFERDSKWCAQIQHNRKHIHLGGFATPELAGRAYDAKARELFGKFAVLNFPDSPE